MILLPLNENTPSAPNDPAGRPLVGRAERLGGVLDDRHAVARARRRGSGPSRRTGRRGRRRCTAAGSATGARPCGELLLDQAGSRFQVRAVAVDEHRARADVGDRVGRRHEGERRHQHLVARADPEQHEREVQRGGAARQRGRVGARRRTRRTRARTRRRAGPSGAIQLESNASSSSARSASPTSGGDRKRRGTRGTVAVAYPDTVVSIVVTGGAGFIGANLCRRLRARRATTSSRSTTCRPAASTTSRDLDVELRRGHHPRPRRARRRDARRDRRRAPRGAAVGAPLDRRPGGVAPRQRHRHGRGARGGPPRRQPPRDRGVVVVGLRRQPDAARSAKTSRPSRSALRREQARHRGVRARLPARRSACPRWRSGSSTCSGRCRRRATRTPRWCRRSSPPRSRAARSSCTATASRAATSPTSTPSPR